MRIAARSTVWLAFLVIALVRLHGLDVPVGGGSSSGLIDGPDSVAALVMGLTRVLALGLGWYLFVATVLTLTATAIGAGETAWRLAHHLVPRALADLLRGVCGMTLALTTAGAPAMAAAATDQEAPITMHRVPDGADTTEGASPITMRRIDPSPSPSPADAPPIPEAAAPRTHVLVAGEHLWSVAESTLTRAWGAPPSDAQIDPYWRALIDRNRSRLADPRNADLVHPGTILDLPSIPRRDG